MHIKMVKVAIICILLSTIFFCAKQGAPGGGPADKQSPTIIQTIPKTDSIQVSINLKDIYIEFSERMDEGSVSKAVFISPPLEFDYEWSRSRKLKLIINDTLLDKQTYVVSVGTEASDEHNNKMNSSYQFAFSTGKEIDRGSINGRVYGIGQNDMYHIFAFVLNDSGSNDFINKNPRYISQSGKDGQYIMNYLKSDSYRLFAVQDLNNNLQINADFEKLGFPYKDVILTKDKLNFSGLDFRVTKMDTILPFLTGIRPINDRYIQLRISESIILDDRFNLQIVDSLSLDTLKILGLSTNFKSDNVIDIFTEKMDTSARYQLYSYSIEDSSGNRNSRIQKINYISNTKIDTSALEVVEFTPIDSAKSIHPVEPIYLEFSQPVNWSSINDNFNLISFDHDTVIGKWKIQSVYNAEFYPDTPLITDSSYTAFLNCGRICDLWGKLFEDSLIHHYFSIISTQELGEISGNVFADSELSKPVYITVRNLGRNKKQNFYKHKMKKPGKYKIDKLPEGQYRISSFWDLDENGRYSAGQLFPFKFSEPFTIRADTIKVRKRWETRNIDLRFPVLGN